MMPLWFLAWKTEEITKRRNIGGGNVFGKNE